MFVALTAATIVGLSLATGAVGDQSDGLAALRSARATLVARYEVIARRMGADQAADLEQRIDYDIGALLSGETPDYFSASDWTQRLDGIAVLDSSIVKQVVA